ncbi:Mov34/MPN/PAD-1 family protein [Candidatus Woesearchaeota archaeon]|nr:Mov34/MPN/PAD-1 family protein [Candidatus Woesearchaeota archaeon]
MINKIINFFYKFLELDRFYFDKVIVTSLFFERAKTLATESYPYEFFGLIEGKIKNKILTLEDIKFTQQKSNTNRVSTIPVLFNSVNGIGTIHSHPNGTKNPSREDLKTFSKYPINIIFCNPFSKKNLNILDSKGNTNQFRIFFEN